MTLPSALQVAETLAATRVNVLDATHRVRSPKRSTRYRYTRNGIIAGSAILLLTAGAVVIALAPADIRSSAATCFSGPSLDSHSLEVQSADVPFDPLANCGNEYDVEESELTVCTLPDGTAGVFPREGRPDQDFCAALGLAVWDSD
jgi:hypothetical protein